MNILLTTYFTSRDNPQREGKRVKPNDFSYIKNYYLSVKQNGLNTVIFHDGLSNTFTEQYETDKIQFVRVDLEYDNKSLNDVRYFVYYDYLRQQTNIDKVFMTDGNDVVVVKNPFDFIENDIVYVGSDRNRILNHYFLKEIAVKAYGSFDKFKNIEICKVANAGVLGGEYYLMLDFLLAMICEFGETDKNANANMMVFNYVLHTYFPNHLIGYPITSEFMKYETRTDVFFRHK